VCARIGFTIPVDLKCRCNDALAVGRAVLNRQSDEQHYGIIPCCFVRPNSGFGLVNKSLI
jgi:hypothetical protein